jgi:predicted amidohydrolase YtcJ
LFATAARLASVDLAGLRDESAIIAQLGQAPPGWVRAIGYDDSAAGLPDRHRLDQWLAGQPLRIQDRTGALWMLNTLGVTALGDGPFPPGVRLGDDGRPNGHIWREDGWLRDRLGAQPPSLTALGQQLARYGITGVTDAGAGNGLAEATLLAKADLPQRVMVMGCEELQSGPLKLLFDERDLPDTGWIAARIASARSQGRAVAAHCVTAGELLVYLAALEAAGGARPGDRIEHGGEIPVGLISDIARLGLTVITQPGFIHDRGDRYLRDIDADVQSDLWRLGSLLRAGVKVAAGSDAPYGSADPWLAIRAAGDRRTAGGSMIGANEAIAARDALNLYLGSFKDPGGPIRMIAPGQAADLCLLASGWQDGPDDPVRATLIGGNLAYYQAR